MCVKSMAMPCPSAALMTSRPERSSRLDHRRDAGQGGLVEAVAEGKNASEARTVPFSGVWDFIMASRTESRRLIWPAPMPRVRSFSVNTMALDFTCLQTFQAKESDSYSVSVGFRFVTTVRVRMSAILPRSRSW